MTWDKPLPIIPNKINCLHQLSFSLVNIYDETPFLVVLNMDHIQPLNTLFYINILSDEEFTIGCKGEKTSLYNFRTENYMYED